MEPIRILEILRGQTPLSVDCPVLKYPDTARLGKRVKAKHPSVLIAQFTINSGFGLVQHPDKMLRDIYPYLYACGD